MYSTVLILVSAVVLLATLGLSLARLEALQDTPWYFWLLALSLVCTGTWGVSSAMRAREMTGAAEALADLKVLSAAELRRDLEGWRGAPVVLQDDTTCVETKATSNDVAVLASRTRLSGEDEVEGEESDYVKTIDYGVEEESARFRLGLEADAVQVEADGWHVWAAAAPVESTRMGNEFSAAAGRNLTETERRSSIPCGARVSVTGLVTVEGPFATLAPLSPRLNVLTDRPWQDVLNHTGRQAGRARSDALMLAILNGTLLLVLGFLFRLFRAKA
ncbi:MAG: hypothetical protein VKS61_00350 [Candidatus Sericytochromatia bacterium]|nr:hypothetical protein [Candidatus Sericytochromatia bacterium]